MATTLLLKLSHAGEEIERVGQALTVASTALASGVSVELWLMGDAVALTKPGVVEGLELQHAPPLIDLWNAVRQGGAIYACTQCLLRRGMTAGDMRDGVTQAGAPAFVASLTADGVRTVEF